MLLKMFHYLKRNFLSLGGVIHYTFNNELLKFKCMPVDIMIDQISTTKLCRPTKYSQIV